MGSINKVILIGNVGKEPEIRTFDNGNRVATFFLATSESWKDKHTGERKEKTEWHRIAIFNDHIVKVVQDYVRKGYKLYIEGQLETRKWQDNDGRDCYATEVTLRQFSGNLTILSGAKEKDEDTDKNPQTPSYGASKIDEMEDDIPF